MRNKRRNEILFVACSCVLLVAGCVIQSSQPASTPVSTVPIEVSNPNPPATNNVPNIPETPDTNSTGQIKITKFSNYDRIVVERISQKWFDILDNKSYAQGQTGKVVVNFRLHSDGTVSGIKIGENNVGDILGLICVDAIQKCAPLPKWSPEMVKKLGDSMEVTFTFDYS